MNIKILTCIFFFVLVSFGRDHRFQTHKSRSGWSIHPSGPTPTTRIIMGRSKARKSKGKNGKEKKINPEKRKGGRKKKQKEEVCSEQERETLTPTQTQAHTGRRQHHNHCPQHHRVFFSQPDRNGFCSFHAFPPHTSMYLLLLLFFIPLENFVFLLPSA